jgi:hypothetical protein
MLERDQFKESDMGRSYSTHVRMWNAYKDLDRTWKNETTLEIFVQMDFKEIIGGSLDWGLFVSECEVMMGMCDHNNEPLGTIKSRYFLYFYRDLKFLTNVRVLWT